MFLYNSLLKTMCEMSCGNKDRSNATDLPLKLSNSQNSLHKR